MEQRYVSEGEPVSTSAERQPARSHGSGTERAKGATREAMRTASDVLRRGIRQPAMGAALAAGLAIGAALVFGVLPTLVVLVAGYAVYRLLRGRQHTHAEEGHA
jgi:hypothetical protein